MYILKTLFDGRASISSFGVSITEDERFNICVEDFCEKMQQKQAEESSENDYSVHLEDAVQTVINQKQFQDCKGRNERDIYSNVPGKVLNYAELLYCDQAEEFDVEGNFFAESLGFWMLGKNGKWIGISERNGKLALGQIRESDIAEVLQSITLPTAKIST